MMQHYIFLILILIFIVIFQLLYIIALKTKRVRKKSHLKSHIENFSTVIEPLNLKIKNLNKDKENYKKKLQEIQEEVNLYSEQMLNIIDVGVLLIDQEEHIIYKNNWFENCSLKEEDVLNNINTEQTELNIEQETYLIKKQNYPPLTFYIIHNITELKTLERKIQTKEKLAYLGEMSAFIAHEFKNSLTAIKGFSSALKRKSDSPKIIETLSQHIDDEINYFYKILTDYLNYSKEIRLQKVNVFLSPFLEKIITHTFPNANIPLELSSSLSLFIDEDKFKQVLINLIKNAIEASEALETSSAIKIVVKESSSSVHLSIQDKGRGISQENKEKIFNPFFTTKSLGTGLGTSISYQIIKAHGGEISYHDNVPQGTIVNIELPKI